MFASCVVPGEQDRSLSSCATNGREFHLKVPPNLVPTSHACVEPATVSFLFTIHLFLRPLTIFLQFSSDIVCLDTDKNIEQLSRFSY